MKLKERVGLAVTHVRQTAIAALVAGLSGTLAITWLAFLCHEVGYLLLIAPFGARCVLLFALPQSPLARASSF